MQCWKSINMEHRDRHFFVISFIVSLLSFLLLYVPFSFVFKIRDLSDDYFYIFLLLLLIIYPIHKFVHIMVLVFMKSKFSLPKKKLWYYFFLFEIRINEPLLKWKYILGLLTPFVIINSLLVLSIFVFPGFAHFLTLLLSCHIGICVADIIYLKELIKSPKKSLIEENDNGYEILTLEN